MDSDGICVSCDKCDSCCECVTCYWCENKTTDGTTTVNGREYCDRCLENNCTYCDECEEYFENAGHHKHACHCEPPVPVFGSPTMGTAPWTLTRRSKSSWPKA